MLPVKASSQEVLDELMRGNRRFAEGRPVQRSYSQSELAALAITQTPIAAVVTCSDSRVVPEVVFDQPLGSLFVSRVPGNVASDSAKWMIDIAVAVFKVPLLIVMGHTGCLAVGQVVDGHTTGPGGPLRLDVMTAVARARLRGNEDLARQAVIENARFTVERLETDSAALRTALASESIRAVSVLYDMSTGVATII